MLAALCRVLSLGLAGAALLAVALAYLMFEALWQPLRVADDEEGVFEVRPGMHFGQVTAALAERGVLSDGHALQAHARLSGAAARLQAGEYALLPDERVIDLIERMVRGRTVQYAVTLVEGWNFRQIRAALASAPRLRHELSGLSDAEVMGRLGRAGEHPEGRFFPDTYLYGRAQSDLDILRRAHQTMSEYLRRAWQTRAADLPYASPYEALIMASIIERETGVPEERAQIAGVFVRRLRQGMKLQTDPTVIYGMGERYDGNIRRSDLREDTPYNTYVHAGLTPTPIASPGAAAIDAALHPAPGTALYFVARGDGSGAHQFSDTYAEHQRAVQVYLQRLRAGSG